MMDIMFLLVKFYFLFGVFFLIYILKDELNYAKKRKEKPDFKLGGTTYLETLKHYTCLIFFWWFYLLIRIISPYR
ncbi:hypothetical protein CN515_05505 [Bacillus cereus]|nr:hypothetical protein CN515_05505 [Bacillus cereus]